MSQPQSQAETRLETQKLGPLQIRVAFLCMLAQIFDGFDISSIGMAVPALIKDWHPADCRTTSSPISRNASPPMAFTFESLAGHFPASFVEQQANKSG